MFDMAASQRYPEMSTARDKMKHLMQADLPKNATVEAGSWCMLAHAGACWRDIVWPNVTCRLSVRSFDRRDLVPTFEGALRDTVTETERDGERRRTWLCQAMRCHAPHRILSSLPPDVRRRRCLGVLGSLNYFATFLWLCEQFNANRLFVMIYKNYVLIYLLINSLTQRGRQTLVQCHCSVAIPGIGFFVSSLQTPQRDGALKSLHEYCTSFMLDETQTWGHWHQ